MAVGGTSAKHCFGPCYLNASHMIVFEPCEMQLQTITCSKTSGADFQTTHCVTFLYFNGEISMSVCT